MTNPHGPSGQEAAAYLGVRRETVHRWVGQGRLPYPLTWEGIKAASNLKRKRGPKRDPHARRYTVWRHSVDEVRGKHN